MEDLEVHKLITVSPLFQQLERAETELILARLQISHYQRGHTILERGIWHGRLYIVASGIVSVLLQDASSPAEPVPLQEEEAGRGQKQRDYRVAMLGPGECFGEMSLLTGEPPTATVRAEQETSLWSLTHADFLALATTCPGLLSNMNAILSQRLARTNRQLLSDQAGEVLLLEIVDPQGSAPAQALAYHIAETLAKRSQRRVLLLELSSGDETSSCLHFATQPGQKRPDLLSCVDDATRLQAHQRPLHTARGEALAALATLAATSEQLSTLPVNLTPLLLDLLLLYDYILLSITSTTPATYVHALIEQMKQRPPRGISLISAQVIQEDSAKRIGSYVETPALFVTNIRDKPILALQEHYSQVLHQPVKRLLPADEGLLERGWREQKPLHELEPRAALTQAVDFVARYIAHQTVGIAFGGGGARGFAHLGVLAGLLEHEVPLDYIAACSIGIIAPGMHLIGRSMAESEQIFLEIQNHFGKWRIPRTSLFSNRGLKELLKRACGELRFEDLTTPFAMVAADLATRSGVVLERGPIWQASLASVALPGIFPPVIMGEHILVDAGMHDPVPIRLVRRMGADVLLAPELGGQEPPSLVSANDWAQESSGQEMPTIVDTLLRSYDLAMATIGMHSIREADIVIRPKLHKVSLRQFSEGRAFIVSGRETLEQVMPQIRRRLPWLE